MICKREIIGKTMGIPDMPIQTDAQASRQRNVHEERKKTGFAEPVISWDKIQNFDQIVKT